MRMPLAFVGLLAAAWLCSASASAQAVGPQQTVSPRMLLRPPVQNRGDPGAFARGAGIYGAISAGLLLGGAVAIAAVDDLASERITRGVWLGTVTLSVPFVALGGWTARKRAHVQGFPKILWLGWTTWTFSIANGILQWYEAFHDESQHWGLTVGLGVLGAVAVLPLALDAYASGRRATMRSRMGFVLGPRGLVVTF